MLDCVEDTRDCRGGPSGDKGKEVRVTAERGAMRRKVEDFLGLVGDGWAAGDEGRACDGEATGDVDPFSLAVVGGLVC